jgi:hypothetical protein
MEDVGRYIIWPFGIFYEHLGFLMPIWYILCSFGTLFWYLEPKKSGNPATHEQSTNLMACSANFIIR